MGTYQAADQFVIWDNMNHGRQTQLSMDHMSQSSHCLSTHCVAACSRISGHTKQGRHGANRKEVALVNNFALAQLELGAQLAQLRLILAQQRAAVPILVHVRRVAHRLGPVRKLQRAHRLCEPFLFLFSVLQVAGARAISARNLIAPFRPAYRSLGKAGDSPGY